MMSYTSQSCGSGGGSPPDLDKLFKPLKFELDLPKINFDNFDVIKALEESRQKKIDQKVWKWVVDDAIEVKATQENSIKTTQLFIMAHLNCNEKEISIPCLPQDLLKEILIIKTISEKQDAKDREATFETRKNQYESSVRKYPDFELEPVKKIIFDSYIKPIEKFDKINFINIKPLETNLNIKKLIDSDVEKLLLPVAPVIVPEATNTWCQIL